MDENYDEPALNKLRNNIPLDEEDWETLERIVYFAILILQHPVQRIPQRYTVIRVNKSGQIRPWVGTGDVSTDDGLHDFQFMVDLYDLR